MSDALDAWLDRAEKSEQPEHQLKRDDGHDDFRDFLDQLCHLREERRERGDSRWGPPGSSGGDRKNPRSAPTLPRQAGSCRRSSLLHYHGVPFAEIGRMVGQGKLSETADTYTHVLSDRREANFEELLAA